MALPGSNYGPSDGHYHPLFELTVVDSAQAVTFDREEHEGLDGRIAAALTVGVSHGRPTQRFGSHRVGVGVGGPHRPTTRQRRRQQWPKQARC
ncbi:hypothetical protein MUK42_13952 [Musa troglodytarum]|uniref:Uncharacterized protein n=1 Tax=Musa troglodytarum TaxID=320322 RepID=A0A9E7H6M5_9LILI|nr:hypothetical protein MUK42_13952 [Musa troglodytarum]